MSKTFKGAIEFPSNFDVRATSPLDSRLVVNSVDDLTNGSIEYPYMGMAVTIAGTSEIWVLKTQGVEESHNIENWKMVTGSGSGNGLSRYSIPVMTPQMVADATADSDVEFDGSESTYILTDFDASSLEGETLNQTITSVNGTYLDIMMRALRSLQSEVARLKNSFEYGIDSYKDERTAKSSQKGYYEDVVEREPLWAIDPGYLSEVSDGPNFNTYLDSNNSFVVIGDGTIDVSVEGQLTFENCKGVFSDSGDAEGKNKTLYELKDSKLITYIVTDKPNVTMNLVSVDSGSTREIDFSKFFGSESVNKYGFCIVISRQVEDPDTKVKKGFNYIYFSIINYENDNKLFEGYLDVDNNLLIDSRTNCGERYTIDSLVFDRLTLYRMKFYTKYEDFSDEVISSAPSEDDWKYEVAHITIRSVENTDMLERVKDQLRDNELIWNKKSGTLHIKSNGKIRLIGSNTTNPEDDNNDDNMTNKEIIEALEKMGIVINVNYKKDSFGADTDEIESVENMSLAPISDFSFINEDTGKMFTYKADSEGNLVCKDNSAETIDEFLKRIGEINSGNYDDKYNGLNSGQVRGFISDYLFRKSGKYDIKDGVNSTSDAGRNSDRLRISSFYAPITTDSTHGCTHSFIELENTSDVDIPLTGIYIHFYNPVAVYDETEGVYSGKVYHLALDGVIKSGGTYLIRGAKHAEFDDASAFIKVKTFDKEWYDNKELVSFEQVPVKTKKGTNGKGEIVDVMDEESKVKTAYRFCLTYGLPNLTAAEKLVEVADGDRTFGGNTYPKSDYPNTIINPRFIDSCSYSTFADVSKQTGDNNSWYINGSGGIGITITENSMFRLMFALDPAKQAYNGFNGKDGSRVRYNKATDIQILKLNNEFIGFPKSPETINIDRYTPKASFENRNVMTDKTQLDREKPNMVTCSFGNDVYNTRCFNWISCGVFDEFLWLREKNTSTWKRFESYKKVSTPTQESQKDEIRRKEYPSDVNNAVYTRMISRFPGNDVLFTAHKCVIILPEIGDAPKTYEYVVGRPNKDNRPDPEHTSEIYTFTLYPRTWEGRVYQITDQQGFHWIEYQVWAASAEFLNYQIDNECSEINSLDEGTKVFPILINTGDMTQSGARINEWLDYYNGGKCLFNHLEQMNCVGNNDLNPINPRNLGTGNDNDKSTSHFFHYFYCFDVKDSDACSNVSEESRKFFNGETMIVKSGGNITEDRYIPSFYEFKTKDVMYIIFNSEIPENGVKEWFGLKKSNGNGINIYTGIEIKSNGEYEPGDRFTPIYETMYAWLNYNKTNGNKKIVVAMHEMPFTVITKASLANDKSEYLQATRNHPNGTKSRVGSNVNQLSISENRGTYWFSRLLEYFGCKIVIGGHKHTYALSYPIKEKYTWTYDGTTHDSGAVVNGKYDIKPMFATLEDEGGEEPQYNVEWKIERSDDNPYNINLEGYYLNSTKTPYIPSELYDVYGKDAYENGKTGIFRCCTPISVESGLGSDGGTYDGFINYSMCQATGYKLKSNKELPSTLQVFSRIIPKTSHSDSGDSPDGNQLYPMYSVLEFNDDCSELNVYMIRIRNIFKSDGADKFAQGTYGTNPSEAWYLCAADDAVNSSEKMYGTWKSKKEDVTPENIYLHIKF